LFFFLVFLVEEKTTKPATTKTSTKPTPIPKIKGCPIKMLPDAERLKRRNLILQKLECIKKANQEKEQCFPKESLAKYKCKNGFKFENNKVEYHSLCLEDLHWEPIPRCVKSNNKNIWQTILIFCSILLYLFSFL